MEDVDVLCAYRAIALEASIGSELAMSGAGSRSSTALLPGRHHQNCFRSKSRTRELCDGRIILCQQGCTCIDMMYIESAL
jgi:hypothetical protein